MGQSVCGTRASRRALLAVVPRLLWAPCSDGNALQIERRTCLRSFRRPTRYSFPPGHTDEHSQLLQISFNAMALRFCVLGFVGKLHGEFAAGGHEILLRNSATGQCGRYLSLRRTFRPFVIAERKTTAGCKREHQ